MKLTVDPFNRIKEGKKIVEVRLNDEKRQKIKIGDEISFVKLPDKEEIIKVKVFGLSIFGSFKDLFSFYDKRLFGHPKELKLEDQINGMREAYSEEKEKEFGALAIHIKLL